MRIAGIPPLPAIQWRMEHGKIDLYQGDHTWNAALFRFVDQQAARIQASLVLTILGSASAKMQGSKRLTVEGGDAAIAPAYMRFQKLLDNPKNVVNVNATTTANAPGPPSKELMAAYDGVTSAIWTRLEVKLERAKQNLKQAQAREAAEQKRAEAEERKRAKA